MEKSWQISCWVLPHGVRRRFEEHPAANDEAAELVGVPAVEVGELQEVPAVVQEQLGHAEATDSAVHVRPLGKEDKQGARPYVGDLQPRDDASPTGEDAEREPLLRALAIRLDCHRRARDVGEEDGSAVQKNRTADGAGVVRELAPLAGSRVEAEDLLIVVPGLVWAEVEQRDVPAVGADGEAVGAVVPGVRLNAAGRTEPPAPGPVGAHEEDALLRWPLKTKRKPLARHLEDHPGAVREHH